MLCSEEISPCKVMEAADIITIVCVIITLIAIIFMTYGIAKKTYKDGDIKEDYNDYIQNEYPKLPVITNYFANDLQVRNESALNCYDYMKSKGLGSWIDESDNRDARNKMRVLGTMRTNTAHFDSPLATDAVTMHGCHIPHNMLPQIFHTNSDSCIIHDTINNRQTQLEKSNLGCAVDFNSPTMNKGEFNKMLDIAWHAFDRENQEEMRAILKEIAELESTIAQRRAEIEQEKKHTEYYEQGRKMMITFKDSCQGDYCFFAKECSIAKAANEAFRQRKKRQQVDGAKVQEVVLNLVIIAMALEKHIEYLNYEYAEFSRFA